jgi:LmbE family N-acetylglucosaminyl deacetylase
MKNAISRSAIRSLLTGAVVFCVIWSVPHIAFVQAQSAAATAATNDARPLARVNALPLPEDRGCAALEQTLRQLSTFKSVMAIVAHPDDEDGAMLTYESRVKGARTSLLTLTRGEGGQNAMSADTYDALGLMRTNELLAAGEYYGVHQYWGTEADFGFSKTREEALSKWSHDRVLYDAVLAVRRERPLVITSTFIGGVTDGHGHHQVSGEIAQEVFNAAGDPKIFPEQFALDLRPWKPLAVYARTPFAPITDKGMFDYATGKWAPAKFFNYVTKTTSESRPTTDVEIPVGTLDPVLGRSAVQIAREGWGLQRSQYGGGTPALSGADESSYHLYASRNPQWNEPPDENDFFPGGWDSWTALLRLVQSAPPKDLKEELTAVDEKLAAIRRQLRPETPSEVAPLLAEGYRHALKARALVAGASEFTTDERADLTAEIDGKIADFEHALELVLGIEVQAFRTTHESESHAGFLSRSGVDETPRSVWPGERFLVRVHATSAITSEAASAKLAKVWLDGDSSTADKAVWKIEEISQGQSANLDRTFAVTVPSDEQPTEAYFHRPTIEQPFYEVTRADLRGDSFAPYPLTSWVEFQYAGLPIRVGEVVQTLRRVPGTGGIFEPLVVTPAVGINMDSESRILPLDGAALPVKVRIHTEGPAGGVVHLNLPDGWSAEPKEAHFERKNAGDSDELQFLVTPNASVSSSELKIGAEAIVEGKTYTRGWQRIGYSGLRPYNLYKDADMRTRKVDAKVAPGLHVGYVMGTGDLVPDALEALGIKTNLLSADEIRSVDLNAYSTIIIGIRAYAVRPELSSAEPRLEEFVRNGGTLLVEYQSGNFPSPFKLDLGDSPERVTDEAAPVKILVGGNALLTTPNLITAADFDGWVEERGHSFLTSWDDHFVALTETGDDGQDPQRGGLVVARFGKGRYIYCAYALYRQLPELVPGAYRILANLVSAN